MSELNWSVRITDIGNDGRDETWTASENERASLAEALAITAMPHLTVTAHL